MEDSPKGTDCLGEPSHSLHTALFPRDAIHTVGAMGALGKTGGYQIKNLGH